MCSFGANANEVRIPFILDRFGHTTTYYNIPSNHQNKACIVPRRRHCEAATAYNILFPSELLNVIIATDSNPLSKNEQLL